MRSCGSYRDELLCVAVNGLLRAERWTDIIEELLRSLVLYHLQGLFCMQALERKENSGTHWKMEIKRRRGGVGSTEQERERKDREMGARC